MAEVGVSVEAEKSVQLPTETLPVPIDTESGVSDDERAHLEKIKRLEKRKKKVALERKAKQLEVEISRMSISDDIGNTKEVEDSNGGGSRDDGGGQALLKKGGNTAL